MNQESTDLSRRVRASTTSTTTGGRTASPELISRRARRRPRGPAPSETIDLTIAQPPQSPSTGPPPAKRARTTVTQTSYDSSSDNPLIAPDLRNLKVEPRFLNNTIEEIDLTDDTDDKLLAKAQADLLKSQKVEGQEKPKLADFKCVICLDDPTDLAATPCGHMFCDFCLQGALKAGQAPNAKSGRCPVCRRKVNTRDLIHLEIKVLKKLTGKGKGRAG